MVAVAAPAIVIWAILALLFILAWQQFGATIVKVLSVNLPVIGNVLGSYVSEGLEAVYASTVYWFDGYIKPAADWVAGLVAVPINLFNQAINFANNTYNLFYNIINVRLPILLNQSLTFTQAETGIAISTAEGLYNQSIAFATATGQAVLSDAEGLYNQSIAFATATGQAVLSDAEGLYNKAIAFTVSEANTVLGDAETLYQQGVAFTRTAYTDATAYANALAVKGEQDLAAAATALEGYADVTAANAVGVLVTDTDNAIAGVIGGLYTDLDNAISGTITAIGDADADVLGAIRSIPIGNIASIAGVAALAGTTALTLTRYLKDCGIPNCRNLSQYGNDLQSLLSMVGDASFLAFVVELAHSPGEAYSLTNDLFGASASGAIDVAKSVLGA